MNNGNSVLCFFVVSLAKAEWFAEVTVLLHRCMQF